MASTGTESSSNPIDSIVRHLLQSIFTESPLGVGVCDSDLRIVCVNQAWATMNGVTAEAHNGKTPSEVLGVGACPIEDEIKRVLNDGFARFGLEIVAKLPSRPEVGRWIVHLIPLKDSSGNVTHVGSLTIDTTPRTGFQSYLVARAHAIESSSVGLERSSGEHLSPREIEVTRLLAIGMGNKEVSTALKISVSTVETHRRRIMKHLNFHSLAQLALFAVRKKLINIYD
jgi:DNA-binding CsgD family transcriptional regulator